MDPEGVCRPPENGVRLVAVKILKFTGSYPSYIDGFYGSRPGLSDRTYGEQKKALDHDAFAWADFWSNALTPLGHETMEITMDAVPLQRAWARENLPSAAAKRATLREIALEQLKRFRPEILWFETPDEFLLESARAAAPSIRLVLGWVGSAVPPARVWRRADLLLSCAMESVELLRNAGARAEQIHHGFDPRINGRLREGEKRIDLSFIGQIVRGSQFHLIREEILERIAAGAGIDIFSPSADFGWAETARYLLRAGAYDAARALKSLGASRSALESLPVLSKACAWEVRPLPPVNRKLKPFLKSPVYGLEMFQALRDSRLNLNIHADSSPRFASNMRLFEATGVGTCLVTDWRDNVPELFEPGKEIVAYRSADECLERIRWLLDRPSERDAIAAAGQARTLRDHTFSERALTFDGILRKEVA